MRRQCIINHSHIHTHWTTLWFNLRICILQGIIQFMYKKINLNMQLLRRNTTIDAIFSSVCNASKIKENDVTKLKFARIC